MRYLFFFLLLMAAGAQQRNVGVVPSVSRMPDGAKRWALLIGVDKYQDASIPDLRGARNDVLALKRVLVQYAGFPEEQVIVLTTGESAGNEPSRTNILIKLANVISLVPQDGLFLFAFSGHGIVREDQGFLLPAEAAIVDNARVMTNLGVPVSLIRSVIEERRIQQVVAILDSCRNEPGKGDADNKLTREFTEAFHFDARNRAITASATLFAASLGQRAYENRNQRGYFSLALEEALTGKAANEKGEVTLAATVSYVQRTVPTRVSVDLGASKHQLPDAYVAGFLANELVLSIVPVAARPVPPSVLGTRRANLGTVWPQLGHGNYVRTGTLSSDGRFVVTAEKSTAKVWEVESGREIRSFDHAGLRAVALSEDGRSLVTCSDDHTAKLWEVRTGRALRTFVGHKDKIRALAFTRDGKMLVTGSADRTAKLWEVESGKDLHTFNAHSDAVNSVAIRVDGRILVTGSTDETVKVWDLDLLREVRTIAINYGVEAVAIGADGRSIVTNSFGGAVHIWDLTTGQAQRDIDIGRHRDEYHDVLLSTDGRLLTDRNYSYGGPTTLLDVAKGAIIHVFPENEPLAFSSSGKLLLTTSPDGTATLWDTTTGSSLKTLRIRPKLVTSLALAPDSRVIAIGSEDGKTRVWDLQTGNQRSVVSLGGSIKSVAISADGLAIATATDSVSVSDVASGVELKKLPNSSFGTSLALSPAGTTLVVGGAFGFLRWDLQSGTTQVHLGRHPYFSFSSGGIKPGEPQGHTDYVTSTAISADGKTFVTGSVDKTARLWRATDGREIRRFVGHAGAILSVALVANPNNLLTASADKTARLWNAETGELLHTFAGHTDSVSSVAVSRDGMRLITGSDDSTARLWSASTGREVGALTGHHGPINAVALTPDGKTSITASDDGTTRIWRTATGQHVATLISFSDNEWICLTPQGYFTGSPQAWRHLNRTNNDETTGIEDFRMELERPDLVARILKGESID